MVGSITPVVSAIPSRLRPPDPPRSAIERTSLLHRLRRAQAPLTLVCGPAGSGKTSLLTSFASQLAATQQPVAWLGLDAHDDDPGRLWSGITGALLTTGRFPTSSRLHDLVAPSSAVQPALVDEVLAELALLPAPMWLVLDDLHRVRSSAVNASLEQLVRGAPPTLRLVLSTRADPQLGLAESRLAGRLLELRAPDLAFTREEVADCLAAQGLELPPDSVRVLHARTEGWVAGVRIAILAMASGGATTDLIDGFDGDDHTVADYLGTEVLARMASDTRTFLLRTSICATLPVGLARHLSGRRDAAAILERLERENAFTLRLGRGREVYRYHELFHTFLRAELRRSEPGAERDLHRAAGRWLLEHGDHLHAMEHLVAAGDVARLCEVATDAGVSAILDGRAREVSTILGRLGQAERPARPVALVAAAAALAVEDTGLAERWLADAWPGPAERRSPERSDPSSDALEATVELARAQNTPRLAGALARLEASGAGDHGADDLDLLALHHRGIARLATGRYTCAIADLERVGELARATGRGGLDLASRSHRAAALASAGRLVEMRELAEEAVLLAAHRGWDRSRATMLAHLFVAWSGHLHGDPARAAEHLALAVAAGGRHLDPQVELSLRGVEALVARDGRERTAGVRAYLSTLRRVAALPVAPALVASVAPEIVRIALDVGERGQAGELAELAGRRYPDAGEVALTRAVLAVDGGRTDAARRLLEPVVTGAVRCHVPMSEVSAALLAAVLEARRGNAVGGHEHLSTAVRVAEPLELVRPFLVEAYARPLLVAGIGRFGHAERFVGRVLSRTDAGDRSCSEGERLTPAEVAILGELPSLLSLAEIAGARALSINTVKTHLRAIYRKLDVDSRRAAVTVARQRGLL